MGTIGCGLMFTGLLLGAMSGSIGIALITIGIGLLLAGYPVLQEYREEKRMQDWRKNYPTYRY